MPLDLTVTFFNLRKIKVSLFILYIMLSEAAEKKNHIENVTLYVVITQVCVTSLFVS